MLILTVPETPTPGLLVLARIPIVAKSELIECVAEEFTTKPDFFEVFLPLKSPSLVQVSLVT